MPDHRQDFEKFKDFLLESGPELAVFGEFFLFALVSEPDDHGVFVCRENGFTWTKAIDAGLPQSYTFCGCALETTSRSIAVTAGVTCDESGDIQSATLSVSFEALSETRLRFPKNKVYQVATPVYDEETPPVDGSKRVLRYENPVEEDVVVSLPFIGFVIEILRLPDRSIKSRYAGVGPDLISHALCFTVDFKKVLVFPSIHGLGVYVEKMIIDLSDETPDCVPVIPGIYDPSRRGIYAKRIDLMMSLCGDWFHIGGGNLFFWGNCVAANLEFDYMDDGSKPNAVLESVRGKLGFSYDSDLSSCTLVSHEAEVGIYQFRAMKASKMLDSSQIKSMFGPDTAADVAGKVDRADPRYVLRFDLVTFDDKDGISGFELVLKAIEAPNSTITKSQAGLRIPPCVSQWLLPGMMIFGAGGIAWKEISDDTFSALSIFLLGLGVFDLKHNWGVSGDDYPNTLVVNKIGWRTIFWTDAAGAQKDTWQLTMGFGLSYKTIDALFEFLVNNAVARAGLKILGFSLNQLKVSGELGMTVELTFTLHDDELSDTVKNKLYKMVPEHKTAVQVLSLPRFSYSTGADPVWYIGINRVEALLSGGKYGIAIYFDGGGVPGATVSAPLGGFALYFYPSFDFDYFLPALQSLPVKIIAPGYFYLDAMIGIDKPLPGIEGTGNNIRVNVAAIAQPNAADLMVIDSYQYRFAGELAWGDAKINGKSLSYLYMMIAFEGGTPLGPIGGVCIYGFCGLLGKNIAPNTPGHNRDAVTLLAWLIPNVAHPNFNVLQRWANWSPADTGTVFGLTVKLGPPSKSFIAEAGFLFGGVWGFFGGLATFPQLSGFQAGLVVVIAEDGWIATLFISLHYAVLEIAGGLSVGTAAGRNWFYVGHYDTARGKPVEIFAFKFLKGRGYFVCDSWKLENFGFTVDSRQQRPTIQGPAFGFGLALEYAPAPLGPSWLNISFYLGAGLNIAFRTDPYMFYGSAYIAGSVRIKISWFKFSLGVRTYLAAMFISENDYSLSGTITLSCGLPWPLSDFEESFDFEDSKGNIAPPLPVVKAELLCRYMVEKKNYKLDGWKSDTGNEPKPQQPQPLVVPIDAVLSLRFDKPVNHVDIPSSGTRLMLANPPDADWTYLEKTDSTVGSRNYKIEYMYLMQNFRLRTAAGAVIPSIEAAWLPPYASLSPDGPAPGEQPPAHQVLYLGTWNYATDLDYSPEWLGQYWQRAGLMETPPCQQVKEVTVPDGNYHDIRQNGSDMRFVSWDTRLGSITISESFSHNSPYAWEAPQDLSWVNYGVRKYLLLPFQSDFTFPESTRATMVFRLGLGYNQLLRVLAVLDNDDTAYEVVISNRGRQQAGSQFTVENPDEHSARFKVSIFFDVESSELTVILDPVKGRFLREILISGPEFVDQTNVVKTFGEFDHRSIALRSLTIRFDQIEGEAWIDMAGDGTGGGIDPDSFLKAGLLAKSTDYVVEFDLGWHASVDGGTPNQPPPLQPRFTFRTEDHPSQNPAQYVAFVSVPSAPGILLYPDQTVLCMGLKYRGQILNIYEAHYGANALQIIVEDEAGRPLQQTETWVMEVNGGPADEYVEQAVQSCLDRIAGITHTLTVTWDQKLSVDTGYDMKLFLNYNGALPPGFDKNRYLAPFRTSHYLNFAAQMAAVNGLLAVPVELAALTPGQDAFAVATAQVNTFLGVTHPGFGKAVEDFYLNILGLPNGRAGSDPKADFAGLILAERNNRRDALAIVLELTEPFMNKAGFSFTGENVHNARKGFHFFGQNYIALVDETAGRMIFMRRDNTGALVPLDRDFQLEAAFDPAGVIDSALRSQVIPAIKARVLNAADRLKPDAATLQFKA